MSEVVSLRKESFNLLLPSCPLGHSFFPSGKKIYREESFSRFKQVKTMMAPMDSDCSKPLRNVKDFIPAPPPLPHSAATGCPCKCLVRNNSASKEHTSYVYSATKDLWERLFYEGFKADVCIYTDNGGIVYAHSNILAMASPVMRGMLKQANRHYRWRSISIFGVPDDAVRVFIRYLYSSSYEKEDMEEFILPLLVLSHVYVVPHLKRECEKKLELGLLTIDNVVDVFQLALLCDAPRLSLICHRKILKNFKAVAESEGWKTMKQSHPNLEKEILESVIEEENIKKERIRKINEREIYLQLYDAMEALVHICRDGCRTIGPHDKDFKANQPCKYAACKGLELLVRHFAGCKLRVPGGCVHCKRMWQLLELHSRLCADPDYCRVPLCRNFKQRISKQSKKDEIRWKILVEKILRTRGIGIAPCFRPQ